MKTIVISQPMFFPWVGLFEQIMLADLYVHYDDVDMPKSGGFMNRVQVKTSFGSQWLTAPVIRTGGLIKDIIFDEVKPWREKHLRTLNQAYSKAPYKNQMLELADSIYSKDIHNLSTFNILAIEKIALYFDIKCEFKASSSFTIPGNSSQRVLDFVLALEGSRYITGHGARNYLNHLLFERHNIDVEYMNYLKMPYPQCHGAFTPYVSILDLIANVGQAGRDMICSKTIPWRKFVQ